MKPILRFVLVLLILSFKNFKARFLKITLLTDIYRLIIGGDVSSNSYWMRFPIYSILSTEAFNTSSYQNSSESSDSVVNDFGGNIFSIQTYPTNIIGSINLPQASGFSSVLSTVVNDYAFVQNNQTIYLTNADTTAISYAAS